METHFKSDIAFKHNYLAFSHFKCNLSSNDMKFQTYSRDVIQVMKGVYIS